MSSMSFSHVFQYGFELVERMDRNMKLLLSESPDCSSWFSFESLRVKVLLFKKPSPTHGTGRYNRISGPLSEGLLPALILLRGVIGGLILF